MDKIIKGLYLGGYDDATDSELLQSHNITHILTVHELKLSRNYRKDFQYLFIETKSAGEIDLLSSFEMSNKFIQEGIQSGGVLVHCQLGMSRSATIVIAYLMFINKYTFSESFQIVKNKRSVICPSDSFIYQLQLFEHMKFELDPSYQIYRLYRNYFTIMNRLNRSELVLADLTDSVNNYKCSNCNYQLFFDDNVNYHLSYEPDIDFVLSTYFETEPDEQKLCLKDKMYIELMSWMAFSSEYKGILKCPGCDVDIGRFCLTGEKCDCDKWVFPAVFINRSKIKK